MRVGDRDAVAGPLDELDVVLAVPEGDRLLTREADVLRDEVEARRLGHVRRRELEEVRQRLRDVEAPVEAIDHPLLEAVENLRIVDHDQLGRRRPKPGEQVADRVQLQVLEVCVATGLGSDIGHVELVVDVAVEPEAVLVERRDRLARQLERDRLVPQPPAADRVRDDGALVADERIVEPGLQGEGPGRLEHPSRHEHDVDPRCVGRAERAARPLVQDDVLADERPVEVAGDRRYVPRKVRREVQPCGLVRKSTRAFRSPAGRVLYDFGMTFFG